MAVVKRRLLHLDPETGIQDVLYFETTLDMVYDDSTPEQRSLVDILADKAEKTDVDALQKKTEKDIADLQETITNDIGKKLTTLQEKTEKDISDLQRTVEEDIGQKITTINGQIAELSADCDAKDTAMGKRVDDLTADVSAKDTAINARADGLEARVTVNEAALATLNGEGEGSVKKAVADGISSIVAGAPEAFDTLKEMSDWISNHTNDATAMNTRITDLETKSTNNATNITNLQTSVTNLNNWKAALTIPVLSADPASPAVGQVWIRS